MYCIKFHRWLFLFIILFLIVSSCKRESKTVIVKQKDLDLSSLVIDSLSSGGENFVPKIFFNKKHIKKILSNFDSICFDDYVLVMEYYIDSSSSDIYSIYFSFGPSIDPNFIIQYKGEFIANIEALELILPGDGFIYARGHINNYFDMQEKYKVQENQCNKIVQPYYYVGLKTTATNSFVIYSDTLFKQIVTNVNKGDSIEILLNADHKYLIKDKHLIVGWWQIDDLEVSKDIPELYFRGD